MEFAKRNVGQQKMLNAVLYSAKENISRQALAKNGKGGLLNNALQYSLLGLSKEADMIKRMF